VVWQIKISKCDYEILSAKYCVIYYHKDGYNSLNVSVFYFQTIIISQQFQQYKLTIDSSFPANQLSRKPPLSHLPGDLCILCHILELSRSRNKFRSLPLVKKIGLMNNDSVCLDSSISIPRTSKSTKTKTNREIACCMTHPPTK